MLVLTLAVPDQEAQAYPFSRKAISRDHEEIMTGWWDDDDDDYGSWNPLLRYDRWSRRWVCICPRYEREGRCVHLFHYRRTDEVQPLEKYL